MDIKCLALNEGSETSSAKFFWVHSGAQLGNNLPKDTETEPFASFLRNGKRWKLIFDARFMSSKKRGAAGIGTPKTPSQEDMNVEGLPRDGTTHVCVYGTRTHRLNISSRLCTSNIVTHVEFFPFLWRYNCQRMGLG